MLKSVEGTRLDGRMLLNMVDAKHFRIRPWFKFWQRDEPRDRGSHP